MNNDEIRLFVQLCRKRAARYAQRGSLHGAGLSDAYTAVANALETSLRTEDRDHWYWMDSRDLKS